jgi:hypothetical protein
MILVVDHLVLAARRVRRARLSPIGRHYQDCLFCRHVSEKLMPDALVQAIKLRFVVITARALTKVKGHIEFLRGDAARMDLPSVSFDGALCAFGLSAMPGEAAELSCTFH